MIEVSFEFIQHPELKSSLVADYREMVVAQESRSWKSVHVLAGSIIEALLVDELVFIHPTEEAQLLNTTFEKLIERCGRERLLTKRAVDLSTVVRGYRNLVHPGRLLRLQETVDEDGANTAVALVRMVVKEVAGRRIDTYGPTAEQVIEKIRIDPMNKAAHARLVDGLKKNEVVRLATEAIPKCLLSLGVEDYQVSLALGSTCEMAFSCFPASERSCMSRTYADLITRGSSVDITGFERALFKGSWLATASEKDRDLIIDHLVDKLERVPEAYTPLVKQTVAYANDAQLCAIIERAILSMFRSDLTSDERSDCEGLVMHSCVWGDAKKRATIERALNGLQRNYASSKPKLVEFVRRIDIQSMYDPFWDE